MRGRRARVARRGSRLCRLVVAPLKPDLGFNDNSVIMGTTTPELDARLVEGVGAGLLRVTVDWRRVEHAQGTYQFGEYDHLYRATLERGIRLVLIPAYAPRWAWDPAVMCSSGDCRRPPARRQVGAWGAFVRAIARRYPKAAAIEVWNEPNQWTYWQSGADAERYTELLRVAYQEVNAVAPSLPVLTGGLADRWSSSPGNRSRVAFLSEMYAAGAQGNFDAIALHVYPGGEQSHLTTPVREARDLSRALTGRAAPIWITELGVTTTGEFGVTPAEQAHQLLTAYQVFQRLGVKATLIHTLIEPGLDPERRETGFGLMRPDLAPKPAYCTFAVTGLAPAACR